MSAKVIRIIAEVEARKCIVVSQIQRAKLCDEIISHGWSIEEIHRRAKNVIANETFNNIGFEKWMNCEQIYSETEAYNMIDGIVEHRINVRSETAKRMFAYLDSEELEKKLVMEGLEQANSLYYRERKKIQEKIYSEQQKEVNRVYSYIKNCDEKEFEMILEVAFEKGLLQRDVKVSNAVWRELLPTFAVNLMGEKIIKELLENVKQNT